MLLRRLSLRLRAAKLSDTDQAILERLRQKAMNEPKNDQMMSADQSLQIQLQQTNDKVDCLADTVEEAKGTLNEVQQRIRTHEEAIERRFEAFSSEVRDRSRSHERRLGQRI